MTVAATLKMPNRSSLYKPTVQQQQRERTPRSLHFDANTNLLLCFGMCKYFE